MDNSDLDNMLQGAVKTWALAAVKADQLAEQIRNRPMYAGGTPAEADERARRDAEASKQERIAAALREAASHAEQGFLVIPANLPALDPGFLGRHQELVRVASAAGRITHRHH